MFWARGILSTEKAKATGWKIMRALCKKAKKQAQISARLN
jgi:hypothetical protein